MSRLPNIVIFNPDEWRGDVLGHMGNPAAVTPNLDALARTEGVSFSHAFCQGAYCVPSRCSFMTGWYPHVRGHRTMSHMLRAGETVLLRMLKEHGYFVWWGGKNDLVPGQESLEPFCHVKVGYNWPPEMGVQPNVHSVVQAYRGRPGGSDYYSMFIGKLPTDERHGCYYDTDWANVDAAREFIGTADRNRPFCMFLAQEYPHPPYGVEEPWFSMIDRSRLPARIPAPPPGEPCPAMIRRLLETDNIRDWPEEKWRELRATYYGMCARVDHQFGLLVKALRDAGVYDDTAIFVFSDHGDFVGDYGLPSKADNTFYDVMMRVPLLIKPPADVPVRPRISDALVELIDFPATVEALTGIAPQHSHFGRSLLPVLAGVTDEHRDAVFCEGGRLHGERQCMGVELMPSERPERSLYWPNFEAQMEEDATHTKAVMVRTRDHKYVRRLYETDELYDLRDDPHETINRIADPALAAVRDRLRDRLLTFYLETGDVVPMTTDRR